MAEAVEHAQRGNAVTAVDTTEVYYDPYDVGINADPYPTYARLREEAPAYHNEPYDFWALTRHADVEQVLVDWQRFSSTRSDILDIIRAGIDLPPGVILFEDPRCTPCTGASCPGSSPPSGWPSSRTRSAGTASAASTRSSARVASTSSPSSPPSCPCGSSGCCSGSPSRTRLRCATRPTPTSAPCRPAHGGQGGGGRQRRDVRGVHRLAAPSTRPTTS